MADRKGSQYPTRFIVLPYNESLSKAPEAVAYYNESGNTCQEWQEIQLNRILAVNDEGKWIHSKYGYSVPRRNGKGEVLIMRELYALMNGENVLHTAHLADTSSDAAARLAECLENMGYKEVVRTKKDETYDKHFVYKKQYGLEEVRILGEGGGSVNFRTRTSRGGLGRGYDLLIIDEAQEYTAEQESSLKYVISSSKNPQTILTGTPPTAVSVGTVFPGMRNRVLEGGVKRTGWSEWSVEKESDPHDKELWYQCNPSLGYVFTEEIVEDEIGDNISDFNIQRLGLWYRNDLKSAISEKEWKELEDDAPVFGDHRLFVGVKFSKENTCAMSIATKTADGRIFVEVVDCQSMREGVGWVVAWLERAKSVVKVAIDGANGQAMLAGAMQQAHLKKPILPTVSEFIRANADFEQGIFRKTICHKGQEALMEVVSHCDKRKIGNNGGFGYQTLNDSLDIANMDSVILAHWLCCQDKGEVKQRVRD